MLNIGYAQEIITPPIGVDLAGYMNERLNKGMYDDLYVKVIAFELNGKKCALMSFDLCSIDKTMQETLDAKITEKFGKEVHAGVIFCATHSHTASKLRKNAEGTWSDLTEFAFQETVAAAMRALTRAFMNLQPGEIEVGSVYNNPYGNVRRYWMKNGTIVTNPGWCNPDIDKPEDDFDRTIGIIKIVQGGRPVALICNIAQHGDTIGGSIVSADWYGRFAQAIQYELKTSLPVMVIDDASGDINHFDFRQKINQTSYDEAVRVGRGYAAIVLKELNNLQKVNPEEIVVKNSIVTIPHRVLTDAEVAEAQHILDTVPDIPKEGDFESQDLANKVPAALRYFAKRALECKAKSKPSHDARITALEFGKDFVIASLPGEPFNGIARAIRQQSPFKYTFIASLAQSQSGYVPMKECFERGGYEVQPNVNSAAPNAAEEIIKAVVANL